MSVLSRVGLALIGVVAQVGCEGGTWNGELQLAASYVVDSTAAGPVVGGWLTVSNVGTTTLEGAGPWLQLRLYREPSRRGTPIWEGPFRLGFQRWYPAAVILRPGDQWELAGATPATVLGILDAYLSGTYYMAASVRLEEPEGFRTRFYQAGEVVISP